eukprot:RCo036079
MLRRAFVRLMEGPVVSPGLRLRQLADAHWGKVHAQPPEKLKAVRGRAEAFLERLTPLLEASAAKYGINSWNLEYLAEYADEDISPQVELEDEYGFTWAELHPNLRLYQELFSENELTLVAKWFRSIQPNNVSVRVRQLHVVWEI